MCVYGILLVAVHSRFLSHSGAHLYIYIYCWPIDFPYNPSVLGYPHLWTPQIFP